MNKEVEKYKSVENEENKSSNDSYKSKAPKNIIIEGLTKEELVIRYAYLVKYLAQKLVVRLPANIELDDLISVGVMGLIDAIDKYDPNRQNKFKTYAEFRIRGSMLDELRAQDWAPRSVREKSKRLERTHAQLMQKTGRQATEEEVRTELKMNRKEYHDLLYEIRTVSLVNFEDIGTLKKADKKAVMDLVDKGIVPNPLAEASRNNIKKVIENAIYALPEKQRLVLSLYYYEELNLREIGGILNVTESRVSQLHTQAIVRLKSRLKNRFDEFVQMFNK